MISQFIQPNKRKQLKIIQEILQRGTVGTLTLAETVQLSERLLKRYVQAINSELSSMDELIFIEKNKDGLLRINPKFLEKYENIYSRIQIVYLNNSLTFQLCKLVCGYSQLTISDVSKKLLISRAHAYRIVKELNSVLVFYDSSIEINESSILTLAGEELAIRTFIYDFVSQCVPQDEWLFTTTSKLEVQAAILSFYPLSIVNNSKDQVLIFFAILQNRLKTKNYLPKINNSRNETYLENFECFSKKEVLDFIASQKLLDSEIQNTEYLYLSFFSSVYLKAFLPDNKLNVGTNLFNSSDPEHLFLKKLIEDWALAFNLSLSKPEKIKMLYSCSVQYGLTVLMKTKPFKIWYLENQVNSEELIVDGELGQKIIDFLLAFLNENMPREMQRELLSPLILKNFYTLFYLETLNQKHRTVSIYMYFTKNINAKEFLYDFLTKIYNAPTILFLDDEKNADIIITDCFDVSNEENQETVIVTDYLNKTQLTSLMEAINLFYIR